MNIYLDGFPHFSIMNNAATTLHGQLFVQTYIFVSLVCVPRSAIVGSYSKCMFNHLRNCQTVSREAAPFHTASSSVQGFQFLEVLPNTGYLLSVFYIIATPLGVKWYLFMVLLTLKINGVEYLFMYLLAICVSSLRKCLLRILPIFKMGCLFIIEL